MGVKYRKRMNGKERGEKDRQRMIDRERQDQKKEEEKMMMGEKKNNDNTQETKKNKNKNKKAKKTRKKESRDEETLIREEKKETRERLKIETAGGTGKKEDFHFEKTVIKNPIPAVMRARSFVLS